ncbi:adenosylmethionine--8-amino-7-oxononanoate transaminase [Ectothiorhodospiraceae bacterium BW-2]|nr:adenosylmethionine--8-amino-7-oxononanoate transaminase [Ectothiorhodospiraceae bacterium BW-2]
MGVTLQSEMLAFDLRHLWHPYNAIDSKLPLYPVVSAKGVKLTLADGRQLIDGMASWWCMIHGYNHPQLNRALQQQLTQMAHVMFGGLTHPPAVELARKLIQITPPPLEVLFFADSGSVAMEAALKMAIQYWHARGQKRQRFLTVRGGYHGDTFGAMSICDPVNGMHTLFSEMLPPQLFADLPPAGFNRPCTDEDIASLRSHLEHNGDQIAAVVMEPIVQGAGGMRFHSPAYLSRVRALCDQFDTLLILDEIATGFGRTGRLFACEHAAIAPDILALGKALTGGYMTLAALLTTRHIAATISDGEPGLFMHGPTFMANPLACAVALRSIELLLQSPWQSQIAAIEQGLQQGLAPCAEWPQVKEVRVLGAIGVVELHQRVDMAHIQPKFVANGVWVRPFGRLVYLMPPFTISPSELNTLTAAVVKTLAEERAHMVSPHP